MLARIAGIISMLILITGISIGFGKESFETNPTTNNGKKWRIAYVEGGPYSNYQSVLEEVIQSLMKFEWIEQKSIPKSQNETETKTLWNFLTTQIKSDYLEFLDDAYWSCEWVDETRDRLRTEIIDRLKTKQDIDLVLALGTWAGQDLANNQHKTPTMVLSTSNAVRSGIIRSAEDSGFDHIHAWIDPKQYERQLRLFHEIVGFKRLGVAYENDMAGRSYAALDDVENLSKELDFKIVRCHLSKVAAGAEHDARELAACYEKLASNIDTMYVTDSAGLTKKNLTRLLTPLFKYKVATIAQTRYDLIKNGILIGAGRPNFKAEADFYAQTLAKILNGAQPRQVSQIFESPFKIVVNLEVSKIIGFKLPLDILAGAYEIHESIESTKVAD